MVSTLALAAMSFSRHPARAQRRAACALSAERLPSSSHIISAWVRCSAQLAPVRARRHQRRLRVGIA